MAIHLPTQNAENFLSILDAVKERTRGNHVRVEKILDLMRPEFSAEAYRSLLEMFLDLYTPAEKQLWHSLSAPARLELSLQTRGKVEGLRQDLAHLNSLTGPKNFLSDAPVFLPHGSDDAALLGLMYVMEGATLGGQIICRHFQKSLPVECHDALNFYRGYGALTGTRWKEFQSYVLKTVTTSEDQESFCAAADRTFDLFARAFAQWPHRHGD